MTTRRGFLQTVGAILGSTTFPAGAVLSVAPVAQVAEVSTGAMAIAAVARQFKTTSVIDARSFEPVIGPKWAYTIYWISCYQRCYRRL